MQGGEIYGQVPSYQSGVPDDIGLHGENPAGRIMPTTSVIQYRATQAKWMGVTDKDLAIIFPALGNFSIQDLGFMKS